MKGIMLKQSGLIIAVRNVVAAACRYVDVARARLHGALMTREIVSAPWT
jgi:hypothetical protein